MALAEVFDFSPIEVFGEISSAVFTQTSFVRLDVSHFTQALRNVVARADVAAAIQHVSAAAQTRKLARADSMGLDDNMGFSGFRYLLNVQMFSKPLQGPSSPMLRSPRRYRHG